MATEAASFSVCLADRDNWEEWLAFIYGAASGSLSYLNFNNGLLFLVCTAEEYPAIAKFRKPNGEPPEFPENDNGPHNGEAAPFDGNSHAGTIARSQTQLAEIRSFLSEKGKLQNILERSVQPDLLQQVMEGLRVKFVLREFIKEMKKLVDIPTSLGLMSYFNQLQNDRLVSHSIPDLDAHNKKFLKISRTIEAVGPLPDWLLLNLYATGTATNTTIQEGIMLYKMQPASKTIATQKLKDMIPFARAHYCNAATSTGGAGWAAATSPATERVLELEREVLELRRQHPGAKAGGGKSDNFFCEVHKHNFSHNTAECSVVKNTLDAKRKGKNPFDGSAGMKY